MEIAEPIIKVDHFEYIKALAERHGIKPLKDGASVSYVVNRFSKDAKNGRIIYPPTVQIQGDTTILDPKTKEAVNLVYVKSSRPKKGADGKIEYVEERPDIIVENGTITVSAKDLYLYYHLEMTDQNESKIGRDGGVMALFSRLDSTKTVRDSLNQDDKELYARTSVKNLSKEDLLVAAKSFDININREIDLIRWDLMQIAKKDPDRYINESRDPKAKMQLFVMEAKSWRTIYYDSETRKWILVSKSEEKEFTNEVKVGSNPEEILVEMLMSAEGKPYVKAIKELNKLK